MAAIEDLAEIQPAADAAWGPDVKRLQENVRRVLRALTKQPGPRAYPPLLHVQEQEASGTSAGTATADGTFKTRVLNVEVTNEIAGGGLAKSPAGPNQILVPAGLFYLEARAPAIQTNNHQAKIYNVTDSIDVPKLGGSSEYADTANASPTWSLIAGRFTVSKSTVLELRQQFSVTKLTFGLGIAANFGIVEKYSEVKLWQLA